MGKKKDKLNASDLIGKKSDPVKIVDNYVGRKGKIGKDKKGNNRFMRGLCTHHTIGKKGIPKPTVWRNADETATCKRCGEKMSTTPYDDQEIKKAVNELAYINQQQKFMSVACKTGPKSVTFFSEVGVLLKYYVKNTKKLAEVAKRQNKSKKNKKKNQGSSAQYGSWVGGYGGKSWGGRK